MPWLTTTEMRRMIHYRQKNSILFENPFRENCRQSHALTSVKKIFTSDSGDHNVYTAVWSTLKGTSNDKMAPFEAPYMTGEEKRILHDSIAAGRNVELQATGDGAKDLVAVDKEIPIRQKQWRKQEQTALERAGAILIGDPIIH